MTTCSFRTVVTQRAIRCSRSPRSAYRLCEDSVELFAALSLYLTQFAGNEFQDALLPFRMEKRLGVRARFPSCSTNDSGLSSPSSYVPSLMAVMGATGWCDQNLLPIGPLKKHVKSTQPDSRYPLRAEVWLHGRTNNCSRV